MVVNRLGQGLRQVGAQDPQLNKLTLLKTAALVLNFKLWPPPMNVCPPKSTALPPALDLVQLLFGSDKM